MAERIELAWVKNQQRNRYLATKPIWSMLLAAPLALAVTPLVGLLWLLVKASSRGPGFYSQVRLGVHGRPFTILKLRTMRADAEAGTGPVWASKHDARATPVGRFLRKYHLDELPQIYNVLAGHMAFVGPRPERPEIADRIARDLPAYPDRTLIKPGITGMAQIHLEADRDLGTVCEKLGYDLTYLAKASAWLDVRIFLATMMKAVPGGAALGKRLCRDTEFARDAEGLSRRLQRAALGNVPRRQQVAAAPRLFAAPE